MKERRISAEPTTPLLEVAGLRVSYTTRSGLAAAALCGVNFSLGRGEVLGVLGESGSGKSTLAAALAGTLHPNAKIEGGGVKFEGKDLLRAPDEELRQIRGGRIGSIFQEPSLALHPCIRAGEQVADVLSAHTELGHWVLPEKALEIIGAVFPKEPERIADSYPHQLSGGQRARVLIAQAIACSPALVIADEPTASLDPTTQREIVELFRSLRGKLGLSLIWITHNPFLLAGLADRVLVLYAGRIVETGPCKEVLSAARHPYTRDLLRCVPLLADGGELRKKTKLPVIRENSPSAQGSDTRCAFEGRCEDRMGVCSLREPGPIVVDQVCEVACFKYGE